jgi:hypothetical protein
VANEPLHTILVVKVFVVAMKSRFRFNVIRDVVAVVVIPPELLQAMTHNPREAVFIVVPFRPTVQSRNGLELRHSSLHVADVSTHVALAMTELALDA